MKYFAPLLAVVVLSHGAKAGSLLGADLQYAQVGDLTWSFTVTIYVDPFAPADMPELFVTIEGVTDTIPRDSQTLIYGD